MVYKFFSGILVESYGTWLLFQRLDDASKDSDIPKNVPFAFAINNRNISPGFPRSDSSGRCKGSMRRRAPCCRLFLLCGVSCVVWREL